MGTLRVYGRWGMVLVCAVVAAACGGESSDNEPGNGGSSGSGGSAGSGGSGGGVAGSGGDGAECSGFANDQGWSVAVTIINRTSETLYLGEETSSCSPGPESPFGVADSSGELLGKPDACLGFCEDVMEGNQPGCPAICLAPQAVALAPEEGINLIWNGLYREDLLVPSSCVEGGGEDRACNRAAQIEPGNFTFRARAGTEVDCSETVGSCPECTPSSEGGCTIGGALISGSLLSAETTVDLDPSYGVGPGSGGGATLPVEIVFEDP